MKSSTLKKLSTFILLLGEMFFIRDSDVLAQCGPCGNNKVRVTKITYLCPYGCEVCKTKCVSPDQLQKYFEQGWREGGGCPGHGCGGNQLVNQLHNEVLPLAVSIDPPSKSSTISFFLTRAGRLSFKVFDVGGKLISTIADASFKKGSHEISWDTKRLTPGIYLLEAQSTESIRTVRLITSDEVFISPGTVYIETQWPRVKSQ